MDAALQELIAAVRRRAPDLVDAWEATSWIESLGWTDARVQTAFGLQDTRALGHYVYAHAGGAEPPLVGGDDAEERESVAGIVCGAYTRTLVYGLPWVLMFVAEGVWPATFDTQPEMAGPISVAVMVSLIATGGFVQAIARKGSFYLGMRQPVMARHIGWLICRIGGVSALLLGFGGFLLATYFDVFGSFAARAVAASYFILLSGLWLACAMLSLRAPRWRLPLVFVAAGGAFLIAKGSFAASTLTAQTVALMVALISAGVLAVDAFRAAAGEDRRTETIVLPRPVMMAHALAPHFVYGIAYFMFLFADRLSAGSAVPTSSGLPFGLALDYKRGIDLAFLVFLISAGAVESFTLVLMRTWRDDAARVMPPDAFTRRLNRSRSTALAVIILLFAACALIVAHFAATIEFLTPAGTVVFALGCAGYCLFAIALLDALTLFSINRADSVVHALVPGLLVNLLGGYVVSHAAGAEFAVIGLVAGASVFAIGARRKVREALKRPDFACAWA